MYVKHQRHSQKRKCVVCFLVAVLFVLADQHYLTDLYTLTSLHFLTLETRNLIFELDGAPPKHANNVLCLRMKVSSKFDMTRWMGGLTTK